MARAFAGPDAPDAEVVAWLYRVKRFEHEFWWGKDREPQFPSFDEWLGEQMEKLS